MRVSKATVLVFGMAWGICRGEEAQARSVDVSEMRRLLKRATAVTVVEASGRKSVGVKLTIEPQARMTLVDATGGQVAVPCSNISEIAVTSVRRSVGSRVAEWLVVAGGGAVSIAAVVSVHPACFAGVPVALAGGRRIAKQSTKEKITSVRPRCATFP